MMENEEKEIIREGIDGKIDLRRKYLAYFILFFPSLIIAGIPMTDLFMGIGLKMLLIIYQFIAIKNFVDNHYE